ncbi:MAG: hypothetical protein IJ647_06810 [Prevotella sp.]|nr:hypothetical protein [Prevotella sp.]
MIKPVVVDGRTKLVIVVDCIETNDDVRELRNALIDVMETCVADERSKDITKSMSLWYTLRLIDETTTLCNEVKGGTQC